MDPHNNTHIMKHQELRDVDGRKSPEYLAQLLKDKKQLQAFPQYFAHVERLLDDEIKIVRGNLFHFNTNKEPLQLPEAAGPIVTLSEKLFVPTEYPDFNFVGRILGPRGMTAKQLEQETGCKIMVRGKGSMREKQKEEMNRGKPNWEHLSEELHVLITVEDHQKRGEVKLKRAILEVQKLLVPAPEGEDELKKSQLMELAIINGSYRDNANNQMLKMHQLAFAGMPGMQGLQGMQGAAGMLGAPLRAPAPQGANIILGHAPRLQQHHQFQAPVSMASLMNGGGPPPLVSPTEANYMFQHMYDPFTMHQAGAHLMEFPGMEQSGAGAINRRHSTALRHSTHPYNPASAVSAASAAMSAAGHRMQMPPQLS